MPDFTRFSDVQVLAEAIAKLGSKQFVAKYLGLVPSAVSHYVKRGRLPQHVRARLETLLEGKVVIPSMASAVEVFQMIERLYFLTRGRDARWRAVATILENVLRDFPQEGTRKADDWTSGCRG